MRRQLGIVLLVMLAVSYCAPFFHLDHHPETECAVCHFAGPAGVSLLPATEGPGPVPVSFLGRLGEETLSCNPASHGVAGCRGPPSTF